MQNTKENNPDAELLGKLESILFSSGKKMHIEELAKLCRTSSHNVKKSLEALKQKYDQKDSSLMVVEEGEFWKLTVREKYLPLVKDIVAETELPKTVIETLAVIAFKHPILQAELVKIRSNKAYEHLALLEESGYIQRENFGRTKKIKLTQKFFDYFDLPPQKIKEAFAGFEAVEKVILDKENEISANKAKEKKGSLGELEVYASEEKPQPKAESPNPKEEKIAPKDTEPEKAGVIEEEKSDDPELEKENEDMANEEEDGKDKEEIDLDKEELEENKKDDEEGISQENMFEEHQSFKNKSGSEDDSEQIDIYIRPKEEETKEEPHEEETQDNPEDDEQEESHFSLKKKTPEEEIEDIIQKKSDAMLHPPKEKEAKNEEEEEKGDMLDALYGDLESEKEELEKDK